MNKHSGRPDKCPQSGDITRPNRTAERIASEVGAGKNTIERAGQYARAVDARVADSPGNQNAQIQCAHSGIIVRPNRTARRVSAELDIGRNTVRRAGDYARAETSHRSRRRTCWASRREIARRWQGGKELAPPWGQLTGWAERAALLQKSMG